MNHEKKKQVEWSRKFFTRKDWRKWGDERNYCYCYYINKGEKRMYNRWLRNSSKVPLDLKNNEWKKIGKCNKHNYY